MCRRPCAGGIHLRIPRDLCLPERLLLERNLVLLHHLLRQWPLLALLLEISWPLAKGRSRVYQLTHRLH